MTDRERFGGVRHLHVTIAEVRDVDDRAGGWRLWCMNCDLEGDDRYSNSTDALGIAAELRAAVGPPCEHHVRPIPGLHP